MVATGIDVTKTSIIINYWKFQASRILTEHHVLNDGKEAISNPKGRSCLSV